MQPGHVRDPGPDILLDLGGDLRSGRRLGHRNEAVNLHNPRQLVGTNVAPRVAARSNVRPGTAYLDYTRHGFGCGVDDFR